MNRKDILSLVLAGILFIVAFWMSWPPWAKASEIWIEIDLERTPLTDWGGRTLPDNGKRKVYAKNLKDRTFGHEYVVPDLSGITVVKRYQRQDTLIAKIDDAGGGVLPDKNAIVKFKTKRKKFIALKSENYSFTYKEISEESALTELETWGIERPMGAESGVTN